MEDSRMKEWEKENERPMGLEQSLENANERRLAVIEKHCPGINPDAALQYLNTDSLQTLQTPMALEVMTEVAKKMYTTGIIKKIEDVDNEKGELSFDLMVEHSETLEGLEGLPSDLSIALQNQLAELKMVAVVLKGITGKDPSQFMRHQFLMSLGQMFADLSAPRPKNLNAALNKTQRHELDSNKPVPEKPRRKPETIQELVGMRYLPQTALISFNPKALKELTQHAIKMVMGERELDREMKETFRKKLYVFLQQHPEPNKLFAEIYNLRRGLLPL